MHPPRAEKILDLVNRPAQPRADQIASLENARNHQDVKTWWPEVQQIAQAHQTDHSPTLNEWIELALLGACVGFVERDLAPILPAHQYVYARIIGDISEVYYQIQQQGLDYDHDYMRFVLFDFGVQCIYHLDWELYLSQELY